MHDEVVDSDIHVYLHNYMQKGSVYSPAFSKTIIAVLMKTGSRPSPLYQLMKQVQLYGSSTEGLDQNAPKNMLEVESTYKTIHQYVGKRTTDVDNIGWVQNLVGWYVEEEYVKDFLMWFDDLMAHRVEYEDAELPKIEGPLKIVVHMTSSGFTNLAIDGKKDETKCNFEVIKAESMATTVFQLPPPIFPARIVTCNFQLLSDTTTHVIFGGNTKPFQMEFVKEGIDGASVKTNPNDTYGEYFRVLKNFDVANSEDAAQQLTTIFDDVLHGSPVVLRVKETPHGLKKLRDVFALLDTEKRHIRIDC